MKQSGDLVVGRSGDLKNRQLTAEARRRGEKQLQNLTKETRRHGEKSGYLMTAGTPVIVETANLCHPERARVESCETSASRRPPILHEPGNAVSGSSPHTLEPILRRLKNVWSIIHAVADEIFDGSAYQRFLARTQSSHSAESYRAFMRERESAAAQKPRCC